MARKMYEIVFSKNAEKAYKKLPGDIRGRIDQKLNYLRVTPRGPDTKKLVGEQNAYRTRVGTYRIVYEIEDNALVVWILDMGHRSSIYKSQVTIACARTAPAKRAAPRSQGEGQDEGDTCSRPSPQPRRHASGAANRRHSCRRLPEGDGVS